MPPVWSEPHDHHARGTKAGRHDTESSQVDTANRTRKNRATHNCRRVPSGQTVASPRARMAYSPLRITGKFQQWFVGLARGTGAGIRNREHRGANRGRCACAAEKETLCPRSSLTSVSGTIPRRAIRLPMRIRRNPRLICHRSMSHQLPFRPAQPLTRPLTRPPVTPHAPQPVHRYVAPPGPPGRLSHRRCPDWMTISARRMPRYGPRRILGRWFRRRHR